MRIGIYGGTFNPIHSGHLHILQEFIRRLRLELVLLIPTRVPPHKEAAQLADAQDRIQMCRLAAETLRGARVEVSDVEIRREGRSYTAETLEQLQKEYPGEELFLLMGEDMFLTVNRWYRPETIFALATVCASPRGGSLKQLEDKKRELETGFQARCIVEDIPYREVSSTEIRRLAGAGEPLGALVPAAVAAYIAEHGIYREERECP